MNARVPRHTFRPFRVIVVILAVLVGSGLAALAARWMASGRIEYWTGPTERHLFVATRNSTPAAYWLLTLICCVGAVALGYKLIADLVGWLRWRLRKRMHGDQPPCSRQG